MRVGGNHRRCAPQPQVGENDPLYINVQVTCVCVCCARVFMQVPLIVLERSEGGGKEKEGGRATESFLIPSLLLLLLR